MGRTRDKIEKIKKKIAAKPKRVTIYLDNFDGTFSPLIPYSDASAQSRAEDRARWQMGPESPAAPDSVGQPATPQQPSVPQRPDGKCCSHCGLPFPVGDVLTCSCTTKTSNAPNDPGVPGTPS